MEDAGVGDLEGPLVVRESVQKPATLGAPSCLGPRSCKGTSTTCFSKTETAKGRPIQNDLRLAASRLLPDYTTKSSLIVFPTMSTEPFVNIVVWFYLAMSEWPLERELREAKSRL
jgi:hypothetical protein